MNKQALIELGKTFGRFLWFGIIGLVGTFLASLLTNQDLVNSTITVHGATVSVGVYLVLAIGFVVKALDRYQHTNPDTKSNGLAPKFLQK